MGRPPIPKCKKCENVTTHKSGICRPCRAYTCKCGEKGIARNLGQTRCAKCKDKLAKKHDFELCG